MFAELPPWDLERKYLPGNLEVRNLTFLLFEFVCDIKHLCVYESNGSTICLPYVAVK